jgi:protein-tyrosine phosphatase
MNSQENRAHAHEILDGLWLGDQSAALDYEWLRHHHIEAIVNCTVNVPNIFDATLQYAKLHIWDSLAADILGHFESTHEFIATALKEKRRVLVHCASGRSRSATIVLAYMMQSKGLSLQQAITLVRERRQVGPNEYFMAQLRQLELQQGNAPKSSKVMVTGLENATAYNGSKGVVCAFEGGQYQVRVISGASSKKTKVLKLKPRNLLPSTCKADSLLLEQGGDDSEPLPHPVVFDSGQHPAPGAENAGGCSGQMADSSTAMSVGTFVLIDGTRQAELACLNECGSWDVVYHDEGGEEEEDGVMCSRIQICRIQRERIIAEHDSTRLEAAAAQLRTTLSYRGMELREMHMVNVLDVGGCRIYLGDKKAALREDWLRAEGVEAIVNATMEQGLLREVEYHQIPVDDTEQSTDTMTTLLGGAVDFLVKCVAQKKNVLVHCQAGRSRSATVIIAYMMREQGLSLTLAIDKVFAKRPVLPNRGFFGLLGSLQQTWHRGGGPVVVPCYHGLSRRFVCAFATEAGA